MDSGTVEVTTSHSPLSFIYAFFKTTIEINDRVERRAWGTHRFEIAPGDYTIAVSYPWLFNRRCGRNSVTVIVRAGETTRVVYRAGLIRYLPGKIMLDEPVPSARLIKS